MAKKNKKVVINSNPLESVTVGNIKDNKFSTLKIIIVIAIFMGVIGFMPQIMNLINKYMGSNTNVPVMPHNNHEKENTPQDQEPVDDPEPEKEEIVIKKFADTNEYTYESLTMTDIFYNGNISFSLANHSEELMNLNNSDLYLELYNNDTLKQRIKLTGAIASGDAISLNYKPFYSVDGFRIERITEEEYEYVDKSPDENGNVILLCSSDNETITYTFTNDKLVFVNDKIVADYNWNNYSIYNNYVNQYNSLGSEGVYAKIEIVDNLIYTLNIDYNELNFDLNNDYYFDKDATLSKVVFIMNSSLFKCE